MGRRIALLFHDRGTGRGWVVSSTPRPQFTPGKEPVPILQSLRWGFSSDTSFQSVRFSLHYPTLRGVETEGTKRYQDALRDRSRKLFFKDWKTGGSILGRVRNFCFHYQIQADYRVFRGYSAQKKISMPYYTLRTEATLSKKSKHAVLYTSKRGYSAPKK
jgi:hypothetical protein